MVRVFALLKSGVMIRTPSVGKTPSLLVVVAVVVGLPVTHGHNHSLEYEPLTYNNDRHTENTNASQVLSSLRQHYEAKYFKCRCDGNQAWNGSGCVDTRTKVIVMNPDTGIDEVSFTDNFAGVTVRNVQCSWDHVGVDLDPNRNPTNQFALLPHGTLSWHQQEYEHYCIDHTLDADGFPTLWEAHVCVPPPAVPRCCLEDSAQTHDGSFSCGNDNSAYQFSPSMRIDETFVKWPEVTAMAARECTQNEKILSLPLNTGKAHLSYESGAVSIVWTTPYHFTETQKEGFCVRPQEGGGYLATICHEDQDALHRNLCGNATCVRKCCPEGEIHLGMDCIAAEHESQLWKPYFVDAAHLMTNATPPKELTLLYGWPQCSMYVADPLESENDKFYLLENGDLFTPARNEYDPPNRYCVDNFVTSDNKITTKALICFVDAQAKYTCPIKESPLYPTLLVVSAMFLGATLFIYLTVPDLRDKLHGRSLISLASAFFVAYVLMSMSYLSRTTLPPSICKTLAFFKHLSLLAAFFWLNVMCFDIWRTLRKTRAVTGGPRSLHRFLWYSLYAWGCALIIAVVAAVMEQLPASPRIIKPNFDNMFCWFSDARSLWVYFYGWVSLVLVTNIIFFTLVMVILIKGQNNSMLRRSREMNRERMWLYVKLFLVMGVTWVAEVVSYQHGKCVEWMFMDIINALEGFTLFLVFILNRTTLRKIRARWSCGTSSALSPTTTLTSSFSSSIQSRKQDSIVSFTFKSSIISRKYSNTSSTLGTTEPECALPLNTVNEAPDESPPLEPPGYNSKSPDIKESELSRLNNGGGGTSAIVPMKDGTSQET